MDFLSVDSFSWQWDRLRWRKTAAPPSINLYWLVNPKPIELKCWHEEMRLHPTGLPGQVDTHTHTQEQWFLLISLHAVCVKWSIFNQWYRRGSQTQCTSQCMIHNHLFFTKHENKNINMNISAEICFCVMFSENAIASVLRLTTIEASLFSSTSNESITTCTRITAPSLLKITDNTTLGL